MNRYPRMHRVEWRRIEQRIRQIPQYVDEQSVIIRESLISPSELHPLCLFARTGRLERVNQFAKLFRGEGLPLFSGVVLKTSQSHTRLIPPPIVESHERSLVIIDGLHRAYYCLRSGINCPIALVSGELPLPPADRLEWSDVSVLKGTVARKDKFRNLDENLFRPVRQSIDLTDQTDSMNS